MPIFGHLAGRRLTAAFLVSLAMGCSSVAAQSPEGLSLHEAVQRALRSSQTNVLDSEVQQAQGIVRQAGLRPDPRLYLQSEDLRPWDDSFDFVNHTEDYAYLGQMIEIDGKRSKRVALATAKLQQAQAYRTMQVRQLVGRVSSAYWMAVSQQQIVTLLKQDMSAVDEMVNYHKARVDAGAMKGVDLLRIEIERDRLVVALRAAERDAQFSRLELFKQMGVAPSNLPLTDTLDAVPEVEPVSIDTVLAQRPDLAATRSAVQAAQADLRLQRANAVPDPEFFGGYKRNTGDNTGYGGLQMTLPFGNRNQGEIQRAQASVTTAQAQLSVLEQQVSTEMRQAYENYLAQREIVERVLPDMQKRARQNLDIVREAYRIGGTDLLRFIDAERTEFDVEVSAVRAMAQLQENAIQLRLAYGVQP
ncbi:MAG TPA: TolC family protein [Edaphobacter sp.]|nr:TolC family protein [Edaphobacter sp.]